MSLLRFFKPLFGLDPDGVDHRVTTQYPLPVSDGCACAIDVWSNESNMGNFSGVPTDLFDNLHSIVTDDTASSPKEILIHFNKTIISNVIGIGSYAAAGGGFSNIEIQVATSDGVFTTIVDESTDATIKNTATHRIATTPINAVKLIFHTANTITLSNIVIPTAKATISSLQGVSPSGSVIDIQATDDGSLKVSTENQFYRPIALRLNKVVQSGLTLAADTVVDSKTITMTTGHGLVAGDQIIILEENGEPQFFFAGVISVLGDVLTLDTIIPYPFNSSIAEVTQYDPDLNKDGSTTVYKAELRNPFSFPVDVTRLLFHITDATSMDDSKFGGGTALTNGISLRKNISIVENVHYWNVKTNGGFGEIAFDKIYDEKAPAGVYGLSVRLTYAGQDKHGVAIRLEQGQAIELLIQDDLTGLLSFSVTAEGHFSE